jgi:hypothetical protein
MISKEWFYIVIAIAAAVTVAYVLGHMPIKLSGSVIF